MHIKKYKKELKERSVCEFECPECEEEYENNSIDRFLVVDRCGHSKCQQCYIKRLKSAKPQCEQCKPKTAIDKGSFSCSRPVEVIQSTPTPVPLASTPSSETSASLTSRFTTSASVSQRLETLGSILSKLTSGVSELFAKIKSKSKSGTSSASAPSDTCANVTLSAPASESAQTVKATYDASLTDYLISDGILLPPGVTISLPETKTVVQSQLHTMENLTTTGDPLTTQTGTSTAVKKRKWKSKNKYLTGTSKFFESKDTMGDLNPKRPKLAHACKLCEKSFGASYNLRIHMFTHTGERPHTCSECGKAFTTKYHLDRHFFSHTGESVLSCSICDKKFIEKSSLEVHKRSHTGDLPYQCTKCNKKYSCQSFLNRHIESTHSSSKAYLCSVCGLTFKSNTTLRSHQARHNAEKEFPCNHEKCRMRFKTQLELNRHKKVHQDIQRLACPLPQCEHQFKRKDNLIRHLKLTHNLSKEEANKSFDSVYSGSSFEDFMRSNTEECSDSERNYSVESKDENTGDGAALENPKAISDNPDENTRTDILPGRQLVAESHVKDGFHQSQVYPTHTEPVDSNEDVLLKRPLSPKMDTRNINRTVIYSSPQIQPTNSLSHPTSAATSVIRSVESFETGSYARQYEGPRRTNFGRINAPHLLSAIESHLPTSSTNEQYHDVEIRDSLYHSRQMNENNLLIDPSPEIPMYGRFDYGSGEVAYSDPRYETIFPYKAFSSPEPYEQQYIKNYDHYQPQPNLDFGRPRTASDNVRYLDLVSQNRGTDVHVPSTAIAEQVRYYDRNPFPPVDVQADQSYHSSRRPEHLSVIRRASSSGSCINPSSETSATINIEPGHSRNIEKITQIRGMPITVAQQQSFTSEEKESSSSEIRSQHGESSLHRFSYGQVLNTPNLPSIQNACSGSTHLTRTTTSDTEIQSQTKIDSSTKSQSKAEIPSTTSVQNQYMNRDPRKNFLWENFNKQQKPS